ncbi:MAG: SDR family oxidoreductase [Candidatus Bathyarchaeia archaeon]
MTKPSKVLVTGGAGFIGSHLVDRLIANHFEVTVLDDLSSGKLKNIPYRRNRNLSFKRGDIRDLQVVKRILKGIDAVFHEAALVSVTQSIQNPLLANEVNVTGTLNLLKASSELGVKRFIIASSAAVYGESSTPLKKEDMPTTPSNPYGITKLASENYARICYKLYGLETVCLRYFNVYGPRQSFDIEHAYGGVIVLFLNRLLQNKPPIVYGDGEQTRDFVYVQDVVEANMLALSSKSAVGESINVGSGVATSVNRIAQTLKALVKKEKLENVYEKPRSGDVRCSLADLTKAQSLLRYCPKHSLEEGLAALVNWKTD